MPGSVSPGGLELFGIIQVGGEEHVEWRAVLQLLREVAGGAVDQLHGFSGFLLKARADFLHGKLQISGSGHGNLLRGTQAATRRQGKSKRYEQPAEARVSTVHDQMLLWSEIFHAGEIKWFNADRRDLSIRLEVTQYEAEQSD